MFFGESQEIFCVFSGGGRKNFERLWGAANGRRRWEGGAGHAAFPDFFRALISLESGKLALRAQTVPPSRQLTRKKSESLANVPPHLPTSSCFVPPEQFKLVFLGSPDDAVNPVLDKVSPNFQNIASFSRLRLLLNSRGTAEGNAYLRSKKFPSA